MRHIRNYITRIAWIGLEIFVCHVLLIQSVHAQALEKCKKETCPGVTLPSNVTLRLPPEKSTEPYGRHIWPGGYVNFSWNEPASWGTDCDGIPLSKGYFNYTVTLFPEYFLVSQKNNLDLTPVIGQNYYLYRDYSAVSWPLARPYIWRLQAVNRVKNGTNYCIVESGWSTQNFNYWCKKPTVTCPAGQSIPAPTLVSPADGAYVSPSHVEFDWNALSNDDWGVGRVTGVGYDEHQNDEGLTGFCRVTESHEGDMYRYYDILIAPTAGLTLPGNEVCDSCYKTVTDAFTFDIGDPGIVPLIPGVQYTWAVRGVNPGTLNPSFTPCPVYGEWATRTFMTNQPPVITDIEVIEAGLPCTLPGSTNVSHWTGSAFSNQIIVKLVTVPFNGADMFSFDAQGSGYVDFVLRGDEAPNSQTVLAGTYGVKQVLPAGWEQTSASCENTVTHEVVSPDMIVVDSGDIILCTFSNRMLVSDLPSKSDALHADLGNQVSANENVLSAQTDQTVQAQVDTVSPYAEVLAAGVSGVTNNPIRIKVTVTDGDGWADIDKVWLDIRDGAAPDYCDNAQMQYVGIGVSGSTAWAECTAGPDGNCSYATPSACNGAIGCLWNYASSTCLSPCHNCNNVFDVDNYTYSYTETHSGNTREYIFEITFKDKYPQGIQQIYAMAYDGALFSGGRDGGISPSRTTFAHARWGFDFFPPGGGITLFHPTSEASTATSLGIRSTIEDRYSGVKSVYDRMYWITGANNRSYPLLDHHFNFGLATGLESGRTLSEVKEEGFDIPYGDITGGDNVHARDTREDLACNVGDTVSGVFAVGFPWVETFGGSVYSLLGYYDPIPSEGRALSQYWIGSLGTERFFNSPGQPSLQDPYWFSRNYIDENLESQRAVSWYDELYSLAQASRWWVDQGKEMQVLDLCADASAVNTAVNNSGNHGIFEVVNNARPDCSTTITLNGNADSCQGTKIIFISSGIDLVIEPDFVNGENAACIFVLDGGVVTIGEGLDKEGPEVFDRVDAYIISQGSLILESDLTYPRPDRLELFGFVNAGVTNFQGRDMIWEDNMVYPTVRITYDPCALSFFREALGRRVYSEVECGIVTNTGACRDWHERDEEELP